jgi:Protein of unknown function (DUF3237)
MSMTQTVKGPSLRSELLDWNLLYLFSFDIELDVDRQEKLGRFPNGFRLNLFAKRGFTRVYNVGRETTVAGDGRPSVAGKIEWGGDEAVLRADDVAACGIRLAIHTDDGALIHLHYRLQGYVGAGGVDRVERGERGDQYGTENKPYEFPIMTSPRFQTSSARYGWLNDVQGMGFAHAQLVRSKFRRVTQDIYALQ